MIVALRITITAIVSLTVHGLITDADSTPFKDNHRPELSIRNRKTRALFTGKAAINRLLGTTRHIFNDGLNMVFAKKGSMKDAILDFNSLNPSNVNAIIKDTNLPTRFTGRVENFRVVVQERHGTITLDIGTLNRHGPRPAVFKTIVYTPGVPTKPKFKVFD